MSLWGICFDIFRFGFALVFIGLHGALMTGLFLEWRREKKALSGGEKGELPLVSVIVPVHNEGLRLVGLLESLAAQDYPRSEYIFIDDRSSDNSPGLLKDFAQSRLDVHILTLAENSGPNCKQYALRRGIAAAGGDFLLFTDADCTAEKGWIRAMVRRMADERTGVTIGPVFKRSGGKESFSETSVSEKPLLKNAISQDSSLRNCRTCETTNRVVEQVQGFFHLYQCFDHAIRYLYLAASTGLGAAGGGFGNNLILRRKTLEAIGGYGEVPVSATEDAALVSLIRSRTAYRIRASLGEDVRVFTAGESGWPALVSQTLRWNNGGLFSPDPVTRFNFRFLMITISMGMIAIPLLIFFPALWPLSAAVLLSMTGNTAAALGLFGSSLPKAHAAYILQTFCTPLYFTFLTILGFCGIKVKWKGRSLEGV